MYEIVILNGQDYPVRFGMNSLRVFCHATGRSLQDLEKIGFDLSLNDACELIKAGLSDGARKAGKDFQMTTEDIADLLDEDFEALQRVLDVFATQFTAKAGSTGNEKGGKKTPKKK
tara:strand:- start:2439 stop:2786 length:348 start_codon:yes stop_codon:yes gene_type:complete